MIESFRLLNQHGAKLWFGSLLAAICVFVLLMVPQLFVGIMLGSGLVSLQDTLKSVAASPGTAGSAAAELGGIIVESGGWVLGYFAGTALLTLLASAFYSAGLIGAVRDAALDNRVTVGSFFSYGFRYLFRLIGMEILVTLVFAAFASGWGALYLLVNDNTYLLIGWAVVGFLLGLVLISTAIHSVVVMFSDGLEIFRSLGYGFRVGLFQFGRSLVSLISALVVGALAWIVILLVAAFPWLVLQFFEDGTVADIVGGSFGMILIALLGVFPSILSYGVFFRRYALHIQDDLFPEDNLEAVMLKPSFDDLEDEEEDKRLPTG